MENLNTRDAFCGRLRRHCPGRRRCRRCRRNEIKPHGKRETSVGSFNYRGTCGPS